MSQDANSKNCAKCAVALSWANAYILKSGKRAGRFLCYCKKCYSQYRAEHKTPPSERSRSRKRTYGKAYRSTLKAKKKQQDNHLRRSYGITQALVEEMRFSQNN